MQWCTVVCLSPTCCFSYFSLSPTSVLSLCLMLASWEPRQFTVWEGSRKGRWVKNTCGQCFSIRELQWHSLSHLSPYPHIFHNISSQISLPVLTVCISWEVSTRLNKIATSTEYLKSFVHFHLLPSIVFS